MHSVIYFFLSYSYYLSGLVSHMNLIVSDVLNMFFHYQFVLAAGGVYTVLLTGSCHRFSRLY